MGITLDKDKREGLSAQEDLTYAYNDFWWNWGTKVADGARTSLIVVPTDGRVPPLTQAAKEKAAFRRAAWGTFAIPPVRGRTSAWRRGVYSA